MAFKQLLIRKDERRLDNPLSAFICVHLRLKNIRNNFYCQYLPAPICGLKPLHSGNLWLKSISTINDYVRRFVQYVSAFICVHLRLKNIRNSFCNHHLPAPICGLNSFHNASQQLKSISAINGYARRLDDSLSAFICVHLQLKNIRNNLCNHHLPAPICGLNTFLNINPPLSFSLISG